MPDPAELEQDMEQETTSYQRSKDAGQFSDHLPGIRPAGKSTTIFHDTAEQDLKSEIYFKRPDTPPEQRKYRKNLVPGEISVHYGLIDQRLPSEQFTYGVRSDRGETVERTFKSGQLMGIAEYKNACAESVYESNKREPLGKGFERGHELPNVTKQQEFPGFGLKSKDVADGKLVLFPRGVKPDDKETRERYIYTHGSFEPGQMYRRNYNWPEETKNPNFRFGANDKDCGGEIGGVKGALDFENDEYGMINKTRIGRATLNDYREVTHDGLGKTKNYCQGDVKPRIPPKGFGIVSAGANDTAAKCIHGHYSIEEQLPDKDLGKCLIVGKRNYAKDENRIFGVPSIRTDISAPLQRGVADNQNYGDEVGSGPILNPQRFEVMGIQDKEFLIRRPKDEIHSVLVGAGYDFSNFEDLFARALKLFDDGLELVSLDSILYLHGAEVEDRVERNIKGPA